MKTRQTIFSARTVQGDHHSTTTISAKKLLSVSVNWHGDPIATANARLVMKTKSGEVHFICQRSEGNAIFEVDLTMNGRSTIKVLHGGTEPVICSGILLLESETAAEQHHRGKPFEPVRHEARAQA